MYYTNIYINGGHLEFKSLFDTFRVIFRLCNIQNRIQHTRKPLNTNFRNLYIEATSPSPFQDFSLVYL